MTKAPRPGLAGIEPPKRERPAIPATHSTASGALVTVSVRIPEAQAQYLRLLSAKTRQSQQDLVAHAVELLRREAGEI